MKYPLKMGCTPARHAILGVDAVVNARGGRPDLNDLSLDEIEMARDGRAIKDKLAHRVRWYGPYSKFFRRNRRRVAHLISDWRD